MDSERKGREQHRTGFLIPAGLLIGLGIGILVNYTGPGALIGLGCGFFASGAARMYSYRSEAATAPDASAPTHRDGRGGWGSIIIGIFFILLGVGIVYAPLNIWPYVGAAILILIGLWFVARGLGRA
jgi:hypothetical protein